MHRHSHLSWTGTPAAAALCLLLLSITHAREIVHPYAVQKAINSAPIAERAQRLSELADHQATGELTAELQSIARDRSGGIAREWLLDRGLHELSRIRATPEARALVEQLSHEPPQIFVQADPDHPALAVPLYDPAATARFVMRKWERTDSYERAAAALSSGAAWPLERFARDEAASANDPAKAGIVDAFSSATPQSLARQRDALVAAIERGERLDEIAAVTAHRLGDAELYRLVMNHAEPIVVLDALRRVRSDLGEAAALPVLIAASKRQEIASAALLEIGRLAQQNAPAREYLFEMLGDTAAAASAATALASLHDSAVAAEIGLRLRASTTETARRELVLALKLDGTPAARAQLDQFVKARAGSAELRKEVRTWLAQ
jgi:hypothetical protein